MSRLWLHRDRNSPVEREALALDASRVKLPAMKQVRRCRKYVLRNCRKQETMRILAAIFGIVLILLVAQDAFETIVLPRRVTRRIRLARLFYRVTQTVWQSVNHLIRAGARRESYLSYLGPLSLLALFVFWAVLFVFVFGFGLLLWGLALPLSAPEKAISF